MAKRDIVRAAKVIKLAESLGVSKNYIQKVLRCDRTSDRVMIAYLELEEQEEEVFKRIKQEHSNSTPAPSKAKRCYPKPVE